MRANSQQSMENTLVSIPLIFFIVFAWAAKSVIHHSENSVSEQGQSVNYGQCLFVVLYRLAHDSARRADKLPLPAAAHAAG